MKSPRPVRIGIVVGEASGDVLGSGLIQALRERIPGVEFEGIAGPLMRAEGCRSLFPMERLSIVGITELLGSLWSILAMRRRLLRHFLLNPPDVFIGIDAPQFNIGFERKLRSAGIRTVHYVSPTIWAWRSYRINDIRKAVDRILVLFPFEEELYRKQSIPVTYVGHPLADAFYKVPDRMAVRKTLGLRDDSVIIGLLPGSRRSELRRHADLLVKTAKWLHGRNSKLEFVAAFVGEETRALFLDALARNGAGDLPLTVLVGQSRDVMIASDVVVLASGTAALEAALLQRAMVVTYKVSWPSYLLLRMLAHVKLVSMVNNLAGRELVPEFLQHHATPVAIGKAVEFFLTHPEQRNEVVREMARIMESLRQGASERAAEAVCEVLAETDGRSPGG
ncbi:MAG: lipid-A-disaccharide synthase [Acidiferrobacteraceae bacterium]|jgi:lipid-A-disaccharide synthase